MRGGSSGLCRLILDEDETRRAWVGVYSGRSSAFWMRAAAETKTNVYATAKEIAAMPRCTAMLAEEIDCVFRIFHECRWGGVRAG